MATGAKMRTFLFRKLVLSNIQLISVPVYCGDYVFLHKMIRAGLRICTIIRDINTPAFTIKNSSVSN